jgi:membrane protein involved in colicin uptake
METVEISKSEYEGLLNRPKPDALAAAEKRAEEAETAKAEAEQKFEESEVAKKAAEDAKAVAEKAKTELEEAAQATKLSEDRMSKVGTALTAKLPDSIKERLPEQAKEMSDEAWASRIEELSALTGVKSDEKAEDSKGGSDFSKEEVARSQIGGEDKSEPSRERRSTVVSGLMAE